MRPINPWVIALSVTISTFMEVLDTSIANVALPHITGSLSVSQTEGTWVLTSYLVANAIVLPLSGWLSRTFGRKRFYLSCVALFTLASVLCGLATSLEQLVLFRVLQGLGGGGLQPSTQAVLLDTFPAERRGMAMAVFSMAVLVAPILGPTLGGWITDNYSWHWIFFINLPVGVVSLVLNYFLLHDPEYLAREREARKGKPLSIDYIGLGLLALGLGCLEVVLEKGEEKDWFGSSMITWLAILAAFGLVVGVIWELTHPNPIVDLRPLGDRNFATSSLLVFLIYGTVFGSTALLPQMLQRLMGYDATHAGLILSPAGIFTMMQMPFIGILLSRGLDARRLIFVGLCVSATGSFWLSSLNLQVGPGQVIWPRVVQMLGVGMLFVPLNTAAYLYLSRDRMNNATGLFSLLRNEGGSVGVAVASTILARREQFHTFRLGEGITPLNPIANETVQSLTQQMMAYTSDPVQAKMMAWRLVAQMREQQSLAMGYLDCFWLFGVLALACIPLVFLMRRSVAAKGAHIAAE